MTEFIRTNKSAALSAIAIVLSAPPTEGQRKEPDNVRLTLVTHSAWRTAGARSASKLRTAGKCGEAGEWPGRLVAR